MHAEFWLGDLKALEDLDRLRGGFGGAAWNGFVWLRMGTSGGLL